MYTIKHAAQLTGIPADTLRMWERRYGVVTPSRNQGGYRLYDDAAIARLTAMAALVAAGWAPREAAAQVSSGTTLGPTQIAREEPRVTEGRTDDAALPGADLNLLVRLASQFDPATLTSALDDVFARHDLGNLVDSWLMPALRHLGDAWQRGDVSVAAEHFVTAGVHRRLAIALDELSTPPEAPRVLVGLAQGSRHEIGVLAFAVLLRHAGFNVAYLGCDIPSDSWVIAVTALNPDLVVLSAHSHADVSAVRDAAAAIKAAKPEVPLFVGGSQQALVGNAEHLGHSLQTAATALADRYGTKPH